MTTELVFTLPAMNSEVQGISLHTSSMARMWTPIEKRVDTFMGYSPTTETRSLAWPPPTARSTIATA